MCMHTNLQKMITYLFQYFPQAQILLVRIFFGTIKTITRPEQWHKRNLDVQYNTLGNHGRKILVSFDYPATLTVTWSASYNFIPTRRDSSECIPPPAAHFACLCLQTHCTSRIWLIPHSYHWSQVLHWMRLLRAPTVTWSPNYSTSGDQTAEKALFQCSMRSVILIFEKQEKFKIVNFSPNFQRNGTKIQLTILSYVLSITLTEFRSKSFYFINVHFRIIHFMSRWHFHALQSHGTLEGELQRPNVN